MSAYRGMDLMGILLFVVAVALYAGTATLVWWLLGFVGPDAQRAGIVGFAAVTIMHLYGEL